jgi:ABC-type nitrate/sulfonate/bicarbonate transport system ATPase subunit
VERLRQGADGKELRADGTTAAVPRAERERRADEALALCGLAGWERSWPDELSGGMQLGVPPGP